MTKTKQSIYVITKKDGTFVTVAARKDLTATIEKIGTKKVDKIYRAIPMKFQAVETVRLVAVKPTEKGSSDGAKDNAKDAT